MPNRSPKRSVSTPSSGSTPSSRQHHDRDRQHVPDERRPGPAVVVHPPGHPARDRGGHGERQQQRSRPPSAGRPWRRPPRRRTARPGTGSRERQPGEHQRQVHQEVCGPPLRPCRAQRALETQNSDSGGRGRHPAGRTALGDQVAHQQLVDAEVELEDELDEGRQADQRDGADEHRDHRGTAHEDRRHQREDAECGVDLHRPATRVEQLQVVGVDDPGEEIQRGQQAGDPGQHHGGAAERRLDRLGDVPGDVPHHAYTIRALVAELRPNCAQGGTIVHLPGLAPP